MTLSMIFIFLVILILFILVFIIFWPLFTGFSNKIEMNEALYTWKQLYHERNRVLQSLKDLQDDLTAEKISEETFRALQEDLLLEASHIYTSIETWESQNKIIKEIEKDVAQITL